MYSLYQQGEIHSFVLQETHEKEGGGEGWPLRFS